MRFQIQHYLVDTFKRSPDAVAVRQGERDFTYRAVGCGAGRIVEMLAGDESKKPIGILSRVRVEAIETMLGALMAGCVYIPLNILAPVAWLGGVVEASGIETLFVDPAYLDSAEQLRAHGIKKIVVLGQNNDDDNAGRAASDDYADVISRLGASTGMADDIAYILYTSGSTGTPKGIMITHRNAFTFIDWMAREFGLTASDRIFSRAPLQFDLSVFDIFSTFASGGTLLIAPFEMHRDITATVEWMRAERASIVYTVPSTYINWLSHGALDRPLSDLRLILYAGEPFPISYLKRLSQSQPHLQISNIYGPTETNIVTYYHLFGPDDIKDDWDSVPIGRVVHDTEAYIVDEDLRALPDGQKGEILIRGGTVFAGYFNDPLRTRERLIQSPFHDYPTLCCRTGDLGRKLPDGNIIYHGRADSMVKTRGYRVEIGEIESALAEIESITELAVIARPHDKYGNTLHAFIVQDGEGLSPNQSLDMDQIRDLLGKRLPSYMIPYEFLQAERLPKTSTGKVDRVGLRSSLDERSGN